MIKIYRIFDYLFIGFERNQFNHQFRIDKQVIQF